VTTDHATQSIFLVRGARYATAQFNTQSATLDLGPSDQLGIRQDSTNPVNPAALLITTLDGEPVGWIPDLLIEYAVMLVSHGGRLEIVRNNGLESPWHLRLLVRAYGELPADYLPFSGEAWLRPLSATGS